MFKNRKAKTTKIDLDQIHEQEDKEPNEEPQKRVKTQKSQLSNALGGSTGVRKVQNQEAVHQVLQNLNYKRGQTNLQQNNVQNGDLFDHETQEAKRKYMENVEMTKKIKEGKLSTKIYRGTNNYANYQLTQSEFKNPNESYKWKHGPTRANGKEGGAKNTCRFDYDPSRCKDWHDSGYCVFGNSCIYIHDRGDYKTVKAFNLNVEKQYRFE